MKIFGLDIKRAKPKKGSTMLPARQAQLFLQHLGVTNIYDDDVRTYIERGYQQNPIVYSIVSNIAKSVAKAKWKCVDSDGNEVQNRLLKELMYMPNPLQKWTDLTEALATHYLLEGNAFLSGEWGTGINSDKFHTLYVLPSENIQMVPSPNGRGISGWEVDFHLSLAKEIPSSDVLHLRTPNPDYNESDNWIFGQSPFRAANRSIQAYNESLDAGVWFLQNKGAQKILINEDTEAELSPEATDQLKSKLRAQSQGTVNTGNIPIIDGKLGVLDISADADDALVIQQRDQAAQEICNVLNYPSQLVGLTDATYQNAKEAKKAMWENCVIPMLDEIQNGLNAWLTPQFGDVWLKYEVDHIDALQEDKLMRGKAIKEFAGMVTINEARAMAGFKPVDVIGEFDGDDMYVGFTQAVVTDQEEISDQNGTSDATE